MVAGFGRTPGQVAGGVREVRGEGVQGVCGGWSCSGTARSGTTGCGSGRW
jgi:hypothetical protein